MCVLCVFTVHLHRGSPSPLLLLLLSCLSCTSGAVVAAAKFGMIATMTRRNFVKGRAISTSEFDHIHLFALNLSRAAYALFQFMRHHLPSQEKTKFARVFLQQRLRLSRLNTGGTCSNYFEVLVVKDKRGRVKDYGEPQEWEPGVAELVHSKIYHVTKIPCTASNIVRHIQMPDSFFSSYQLQPVPERRAPIMPVQSSHCTSCGELSFKPNEDGLVVIDDLQAWLHTNDPDFDRHIEEAMRLKYGRVALYAVFDGHLGVGCKDFLCQNLPFMIARELVKKDCSLQNIEVALTRSFAYLDARLIRVNDDGTRICDNRDGTSSGAAAVVALVTSGEIITAHVGDCRAMLCRAQHTPSGDVSGCEALEMTTVTYPLPECVSGIHADLVSHHGRKKCLHLLFFDFNTALHVSQDHNKESESEFARVVREGGDACNLSVAVTRAFGDVDSFRFRTYLLLLADYLALASYLHFFCIWKFASIVR